MLHKKPLLTKPAKHWPRLRKETGRKRQEKKQIILNGAVPAGDPVKITRWLESYMKLKEMLLIPRMGDSAIIKTPAWQSRVILCTRSHGKGHPARPWVSIKPTKGVACIREISAMCLPKANT